MEKYNEKSRIDRARGIIFYENNIILMKREKIEENKKYYVFPGGGIEKNETPEQALHREIFEELGIKIQILKILYLNTYNNQINGYYLCKYLSGIPGTGKGPEFTDPNYSGKGTYMPVVIPISVIKTVKNLVPEEIKNKLIFDLKTEAFNNLFKAGQ